MITERQSINLKNYPRDLKIQTDFSNENQNFAE